MHGGPVIVVCGCIGAGKSTTVRVLSETLGHLAQGDAYEGNDFLAGFYEQPERWAFQTQLYFLVEMLGRDIESARRQGAVQELNPLLVVEVINREFGARGFLSNAELALLGSVAEIPGLSRSQPDLYVLLDADTDVLLRRIARRGRAMEAGIEPDFLQSLRDRYRSFLESQPVPTVEVSTDRLDVRESQGRQCLVDAIKTSLEQGRSARIPT